MTDKNYFYHIKPTSSELSKKSASSRDIFVTDSIKQYEDLKRYNEAGYNIYISLNTFFGDSRKSVDLYQLKHILIDLDYKDGQEKPTYLTIRKKAKDLQHEYNIYPIEINETLNGYHLVYRLSDSLSFLKNDIYIDLFTALNSYFIGDPKAKQITGLRKLPGFIDHKSSDDFTIITREHISRGNYHTVAITPDNLVEFGCISKSQLSKGKIFKKKLKNIPITIEKDGTLNISKFNITKKQKLENSLKSLEVTHSKEDLYSKIEDIDAKHLITVLNKNYAQNRVGFDKEITIGSDGQSIDNTSGLKLFYKNGKYTFKDFADKGRYGIRFFLLYYYFDIKNTKSQNQRIKKISQYSNFLKREFGISTHTNKKKFQVYDKFLYDLINDKLQIKYENLKNNPYISQDIIDNIDKHILNVYYLYMILECILQEQGDDKKIDYNIICTYLGLKNTYAIRRKIRSYCVIISETFMLYEFTDRQNRSQSKKQHLGNFKFYPTYIKYTSLVGESNTFKQKNYKYISIYKDSFFISKGFQQDKGSWLIMLFILYSIEKSATIKVSLRQLQNLLSKHTNQEYNSERYINDKFKKIIKYAKFYNFIHYYYKKNTTYTIGKRRKKKKTK